MKDLEKLISLAQVEQLIETVIKDWTPHLSVNPLLDFKKRLSSLPSLESKINTLQRYVCAGDDGMEESKKGFWVKYEDVKNLLNR